MRNRYFTGQLLDANDFTREQTYSRNKGRLINRTMFGWGVVSGLDVSEGDGASEIVIEPGFAIDGWGREIVVSSSIRLDVAEGSGGRDHAERPREPLSDGWLTIRLAYREVDQGPTPAMSTTTPVSGTAVEGHTVLIRPDLPEARADFGATLPEDPSVALASVRPSSDGSRLEIDGAVYRRELPSNAALLEMVRALEQRISRLSVDRPAHDPPS